MITYASYAPKEMTIKSSAISIVIMNILVSVLAGLAIFPALKRLDMNLRRARTIVQSFTISI